MPIRRVTLEELRCAIRWRVGVEAVKRHEPKDIDAAINRAIARFREAVSSTGEPYFLARADLTISAGAASGLPYQTVSLASFTSPCLRVYGVEIVVDGRTIVLEPVTFGARNDYHDVETDRASPIAWTHVDAETIAVLPAPDRSYSARIWYLPPATAVENNGDRIEVLSIGDEWIIREVSIQLLERDSKPELIGVLAQERDSVMAEMLVNLNKLHRTGPVVRRDTRRIKRWHRWRARLQK